MTFKRKIYDELTQWKKNANGTKALLVEGAGRVGKSTIVREFVKREYKSCIEIDFGTPTGVLETVKRYFSDHLEKPDTLFALLSEAYGVPLFPRESAIVFNEVDKFPRARECIKRLVQDGRYDYIETGTPVSLTESSANILIPSEEHHIKMYPMDFEEFCLALGDEETPEIIRKSFDSRTPLSDERHKATMFLFRQYMAVGGMPGSIGAFVRGGKDLTAAEREKKDILTYYRSYIVCSSSSGKFGTLNLFDHLPGYVSIPQKRLLSGHGDVYFHIAGAYEPLVWLTESMICNACFSCPAPGRGLKLGEDADTMKCYMGDTGLLLTAASNADTVYKEEPYREAQLDDFHPGTGILYENAVAQMLASSGHGLYFHDRDRKTGLDVDFLITDRNAPGHICPIEVSAGTHGPSAALNRIKEKFPKEIRTCVAISSENLRTEGDILYLPPYMTLYL